LEETMTRKLLVCLLAALLPICAAQASLITFAFTGVIDNDPFRVFDNATFAAATRSTPR
jgi:hypothetical protein